VIEGYRLRLVVGRGAFSCVWRAMHEETGEEVQFSRCAPTFLLTLASRWQSKSSRNAEQTSSRWSQTKPQYGHRSTTTTLCNSSVLSSRRLRCASLPRFVVTIAKKKKENFKRRFFSVALRRKLPRLHCRLGRWTSLGRRGSSSVSAAFQCSSRMSLPWYCARRRQARKLYRASLFSLVPHLN